MSEQRDFSESRRALTQALDELAAYLGAAIEGKPLPMAAYASTPPPLARLSQRLGLTRFEQDLLLLAAAADLDRQCQQLLALAQNDAGKPWLSFGLAMQLLPDPALLATTPIGRLRRWRLLEPVGPGGPLDARLAVDETILHTLAGIHYPDPRLEAWFRPQPPATISDRPDPGIDEIAREWQSAADLAQTPVIRVSGFGGESYGRQLAAGLGLKHYRLIAHCLPHGPQEREALSRLWEREALLQGALLEVDPVGLTLEEERRLADFIEGLQSLILLSGETSLPLQRAQRRVELSTASANLRLASWQQALGEQGRHCHGQLTALAEQFHLTPGAIQQIADSWQRCGGREAESLWEACRREARKGLEQLAQRVEARASWQDLVLPSAALTSLRTLAAQVRQRSRVYRDWGFAEHGPGGLGISALFAGGSGTGKTMAAEVLANDLGLDLYRIDLAALVSKYIGETEKNLARVFTAAEASGAILLFDEADALFGKRSEVRDSHDRYANLEVSYLLQRIETYRGLAILTTNLKQALDSSFQRRIRFIVHFPFPDVEARCAIWQRVFPRETPLDHLDIAKLARLSLSGGHIRNLALNAAFLAADGDDAVAMHHLRLAAEAEFAKLEKPLPPAEVGDWL